MSLPASDKGAAPPAPPANPVKSAADMSLRDYFAAQAMQAVISDTESVVSGSHKNSMSPCEFIAGVSYEIADAMLKEREKQNG